MCKRIVICGVLVIISVSVYYIVLFISIGDIAIYDSVSEGEVSSASFWTDLESAKKFNKSTKISCNLNASIMLKLSGFSIFDSYIDQSSGKLFVKLLVKTEYKGRRYYSLTTNQYFVVKTSREKFIKGYGDMIKKRIGSNFQWSTLPVDNFTPQYLGNILYDYKYVEPLHSCNNRSSHYNLKLRDENGKVINNSSVVITIGNE
jgi:hypothetical protein